jgi:hypothetical protein
MAALKDLVRTRTDLVNEGGAEVRVAEQGVPDQGDPAHAGEYQAL